MAELQKSPWLGWKTIRLIGRGSFGTVYEIQRELIDGTVELAAMKVITVPQNPDDIEEMYGDGLDEESITETFHEHLKNIVAEYTLMQKLDGNANVVNCKDISYIQHSDGIGWDIFIRMELLTPLTRSLPEYIDEKTVVKIGRDICNALVLCKKYDIVHRDIKPQNIFVSTSGDYKLGDFGIAKTVEKTMGGTKIGTYKYMAPEVYNNQPYGSAADIYSLGLVLYWLLNERRMPFMPLPPAKILAGKDETARQRRLSGEPLPVPACGSTELKRIVLKACAYDPSDRYHTADEMLADLNRLNSECEAAAKNQNPPYSKPTEALPDDAEDATSSILGKTADADKTEGTVGVFGQKEENAAELPRKEKGKKKHSNNKLYAAIVSVALLTTLTILAAWMQSGEKTIPTMPEAKTFYLGMVLDEFDQVSANLAEEAKLWTRETAPQKLTDFPFFPQPVFDLFEAVKGIQAEVNVADSTFTWAPNLLVCSLLLTLEDIELTQDYFDSNGRWISIALEKIGNSTYSLPTPVDKSKNNSSQIVYISAKADGRPHNVYFDINYDISEEHNPSTAVGAIHLALVNHDCTIRWECDLWASNYVIWVYSPDFECECLLTYDINTGKLVNMSK